MVLRVSSSTTNQWPQNHIDEKKQFMASTDRDMETPSQEVQLQNQSQNQINQNLKCPRCDSSNTKFCYYNNYSLSQPRHFCKACKRYWTRGGTLRNVPVGGGCRKNKKIKKQPSPSTSIDGPIFSSTSTSNPNVLQPQINISSTSNPINPFLYGLPANPSELNLPYPSFTSRVSEFHLDQPHLNAHGLGFSSNGFYPNKENHDEDIVGTSNPLLSSYAMFGSSSASTSPNMASFFSSRLHIGETYGEVKDVKMEGGPNRLDWNVNFQNQIEQSDPSLYWNATNVGPWLDPSNGSSLPSLI